jgi:large subunit ribosomal protein LP2
MKVVAAYLLAVLGGNDTPNAKDIKNILKSVGANADDAEITKLIDELADKSVFDVIEQGRKKLASVPSGGGATGGASAPATGAASAAPVEEAKKDESSSSSEEGGFGGLFGCMLIFDTRLTIIEFLIYKTLYYQSQINKILRPFILTFILLWVMRLLLLLLLLHC